MIVPRLAIAAETQRNGLFLLAEVPFDEHLRRALRWQHEHLNDIESGGLWTADGKVAVLHAFVRSDQGEQVDFEVRFDLAADREALKAAGHSGVVLLIEDAHEGRPTSDYLVNHALEITHVPADALALALAATGA